MSSIRDLARALGVSIGTVSRALNGRPEVNAETRARILAAAEAQGYVANPAARSLRKGSTNLVAFLFAPPEPGSALADVFFMDVVEGIQADLSTQGLELIVLPCPPGEDPDAYLRRLLGRRFFDALILMGGNPQMAKTLASPGVPLIGLEAEGPLAPVRLDQQSAAVDALGRLRALGHQRVALSSGRTALRVDWPGIVELTPSWTENHGRALGVEWLTLEEPPTVLVVDNDHVAAGVYSALAAAGHVPGGRRSVVSLRAAGRGDNLSPTLCRCSYDPGAMGTALARATLAVLGGQAADGSVTLTVPAEFRAGDSLGAPV